MQRDPRAFLWDVRESALAIQTFTAGMDAAAYAESEKTQSAAELPGICCDLYSLLRIFHRGFKPIWHIMPPTVKLQSMRPSEALSRHRPQIREIALRHHVSDVRVFGSALHGDDTVQSDLDLLVQPTSQTTMMDIGAIRFELKKLLGLEVDVLTPNGLPAKFRDQVLREALPV